jgi:hypothetical protein
MERANVLVELSSSLQANATKPLIEVEMWRNDDFRDVTGRSEFRVEVKDSGAG